jgi:uncharacterized protein (DUF2236 family)
LPLCWCLIGVIVLRYKEPERHRGFRVPFGPVIPVLSVLFCVLLMAGIAGEDVDSVLCVAGSVGRAAGIRGEMSDTVGAWQTGSHYEANEVAALRWVFATLVESALVAYECVGHLSDAEREQYYEESKTTAALFGIPAEELPPDWAAFEQYCREIVASDTLAVSEAARSMGLAILSGAGSWIRPPRWYRNLTIGWLPVRIRNEFGLTPSLRDERASDRACRWLPHLWRMLPRFLRFVGPYQEAMARISNHSVSGVTRISNRFWIGQSHLPFTEEP